MGKKITVAIIVLSLVICIPVLGAHNISETFRTGLLVLQYYTSSFDLLITGLKPLEIAISQFELSIAENQNVDESLLLIALIYQQLGNPDKALDYLDFYLQRNPEESWAYVLQGDLWDQLGDQEQALEYYEKAIAHGEYAKGYYGVGTVKVSQEKNSEAIEAFARCIEIAPDFLEARMQLASTYFNSSQFDEALEQFELVVRYDPYLADAHYYLSVLYERNGDLDKAQHARIMAVSYGSSLIQ